MDDSILLLVRFKIGGRLRFLSHAETLRVLQRACARAGINIQHTQGFNPHPRMSLPLPRPVGIESDDELLCMRIICDPNEPEAADYPMRVKTRLSDQLPEGFGVLLVSVARPDASFVPSSAMYVLPVGRQYLTGDLRARIEQVLASGSLCLERKAGPESPKSKTVDVRRFLQSIELKDGCVIVRCNVSPAGSIRIEEILQLLDLDTDKLAGPIRRTSVQWQGA